MHVVANRGSFVIASLMVIATAFVIALVWRTEEKEPRRTEAIAVDAPLTSDAPAPSETARARQLESVPQGPGEQGLKLPGWVLSDDLTPINRASVAIQESDGRWRLVGTTDANGAVELESQLVPNSTIIARADGYADASITITDSLLTRVLAHQEEIVLLLPEGAGVKGRVVCMNGDKVGSGIRVTAKRIGGSLRVDERDVRAAEAGFPSMVLATTDDNGEFQMDGMDPSSEYSLVAGGLGYFMKGRMYRVVPGLDHDIEIRVCALTGSILQFVESDGTPVPIDRFMVEEQSQIHSSGFHVPAFSCNEFRLSGVDTQRSPSYRYPFFHTQCTEVTARALEVVVDLPCYKPVRVEVPDRPVVAGVPHVEEVKLTRDFEGDFGRVVISFQWSEALLSAMQQESYDQAPAAYLEFSSRGRVIWASVRAGQEEAIHSLPEGDYIVKLLVPVGPVEVLPISGHLTTVTASADSPVAFDLAALSGIVVEVEDPYELGPVWIDVRLRPASDLPGKLDIVPRLLSRRHLYVTSLSRLLPVIPAGEYECDLVVKPGDPVARKQGHQMVHSETLQLERDRIGTISIVSLPPR